MKTTIVLLTIFLLTACYTSRQPATISSYRKQYTRYANELISNTNPTLSTVLSNKLEQYKQTNLFLFNIK